MDIYEVMEKHSEMYRYISEETKKRKRYITRDGFLRKNEISNIFNDDFCCEFVSQVIACLGLDNKKVNTEGYNSGTFGEEFCKRFCPCKWDNEVCFKSKLVGEYESLKVTDWEKLSELAEKISYLPFRKEFDITPEQAKVLRKAGFGEIYSTKERGQNESYS